ncbi:hypothetical protein [Thalassoporum mexicanum]|uniref:hypothetical protein n=1 Tax=Thalassoporum mexicanum TaxID=3457544 RepID=UPI0005A143F6|nr:hypothetical protein [Pseudanabaena sp. PCC 7367]
MAAKLIGLAILPINISAQDQITKMHWMTIARFYARVMGRFGHGIKSDANLFPSSFQVAQQLKLIA